MPAPRHRPRRAQGGDAAVLLSCLCAAGLAACSANRNGGGLGAMGASGGSAGSVASGSGVDTDGSAGVAIGDASGTPAPSGTASSGSGVSDDGGSLCDPSLACPPVITCVNGMQYPSGCGASNCDKPIGSCLDSGSLDAGRAADGDTGVGDLQGAPGDSGEASDAVTPPAQCPGDPAQGWTEYMDTFSVQYPYDLMASDRFSFQNGIYTLWVFPTDKPHAPPPNTTAPRTEMKWSDFTTGEHMWTGDVMFESPLTHTCIFQIKSTGPGEAVYLQVNGGDLRNGAGANFATGLYNTWFNLKVAFNPATLVARIWLNNCLKLTVNASPDTGTWYFKNGVYTCNATICRDHYTNIHLYKR